MVFSNFFRKKVQFFAKKVCSFKINVYFCAIIDIK